MAEHEHCYLEKGLQLQPRRRFKRSLPKLDQHQLFRRGVWIFRAVILFPPGFPQHA
jgi:hypothetical protein